GGPEPVEQELRETLPGLARADAEKEGCLGREDSAQFLAALVEGEFELRQGIFVELVLRQIDDGLDRRNDAMPAGGGEQRGVIAPTLITEIVGKVDDLRSLSPEQAGMGE